MLHILLIILKILGLLLLLILGLLLMIVLTVLLVPVRYRADLSADEEKTADVRVIWLLGLAEFRAMYDGSVNVRIRILWKRLFDKKMWPDSDEHPEEETPHAKEAQPVPEMPHTEEAQPVVRTHPAEEAQPKEEEPEADDSGIMEAQEIRTGIPEKSENRKSDKIRNLFGGLKAKGKSVQDAYKSASEKIEKVRTMISDSENQETVRLILRQIKKIIRYILPHRLKGRIRFGFEDPALTGQILAAVSPFYGLYAKTLALEPVFDEKIFEGELHLKGRIRVASLLWPAVRVLLNKNFRKQLRNLRSR